MWLDVKKFEHLAVGGILLGSLYLFWPTLFQGYFADDYFYSLASREWAVQPVYTRLVSTIDATPTGSSWRPLTALSWRATMPLNNPVLDHAVSLGLWLMILSLIYLLLRTVIADDQRWWRVATLALVASGPLWVEPIYWVAARGDLLAALFGLLALWLWLKNYWWGAVVALIFSLLAKEVWATLPLIFILFSQREKWRKNFLALSTSVAVVGVWFFVRQLVTGFVFAAYSNAYPLQQQNLSVHLLREIYTFILGLITWGQGFLSAVLWLQSHRLIAAGMVIIFLGSAWYFSGREARRWFLAVGLLLGPMLLSYVPVTAGVESLAETRYWFAPGILAFIWLAVFWTEKNQKRSAQIFSFSLVFLWCLSSIFGVRHNLQLVSKAAEVRDILLEDWAALPESSSRAVALLPDTYFGVHLFASPFFAAALRWHDLSQPAAILPIYQRCGSACTTPAVLASGKEITASAPDPRFFVLNSPKHRSQITLASGETPLVVWDGVAWQAAPTTTVEKSYLPHY